MHICHSKDFILFTLSLFKAESVLYNDLTLERVRSFLCLIKLSMFDTQVLSEYADVSLKKSLHCIVSVVKSAQLLFLAL